MVEEGNQGVGMRGISCKKREVKIGWRMNWEWQQGKRAGKQGAKSSSRQCKSPEGTGSPFLRSPQSLALSSAGIQKTLWHQTFTSPESSEKFCCLQN